MARPLPNRIAAARPRAASLPRIGAGGLLPPLLLAAATLLCLLAAYSVRPDVRVFNTVRIAFQLEGVTKDEAEHLVERFKGR